jgi:hypothetical protein
VTALDPWAIAADVIDPAPNPHVHEPVTWVTDRTREWTWSKQRHILESVRDHRLTAVPSCHGPGKSFTGARVAAWWLDAHPELEAFVVTSAPTDPQVKAILWREIQRAHKRMGGQPGRITQDAQWKIGDELVAFGRKPADIAAGSAEETVTAFQGIHARYVLVIFDEASGIPKPLWTAAQSLLTNADARFLAIGNPDDPSSEFARICAGAPEQGGLSTRGWNVIPISLFDTPNFTGEDVPAELRPYLPSQEWLDSFVLNVGGPGTAIHTSKVLGRFPEDKADGVIPWSWIHGCRTEDGHARALAHVDVVELGVDVGASDNGDWTVIRERRGTSAGRRWSVQSSDPEIVAGRVVEAAGESGAQAIKVDAIGVGWGLTSLLARDLPGVAVAPVVVSEAAPDGPNGERYANLRAALWWEIGRLLSQAKAWDLFDVDERTMADLAEPKWWEDRSGRIVIEPKDQVRARLGRSPDDADALLLAFYVPPGIVDQVVEWNERVSISEY